MKESEPISHKSPQFKPNYPLDDTCFILDYYGCKGLVIKNTADWGGRKNNFTKKIFNPEQITFQEFHTLIINLHSIR